MAAPFQGSDGDKQKMTACPARRFYCRCDTTVSEYARGATTCLPYTLSHHYVCHTSQVAKTPEHVTGSGERFFGSGSTPSSPGNVLVSSLDPAHLLQHHVPNACFSPAYG